MQTKFDKMMQRYNGVEKNSSQNFAHILISFRITVFHTPARDDFSRVPGSDWDEQNERSRHMRMKQATHFPTVPSLRVTDISVTVLHKGFFSGALMGSGA
jgi:hypothetical protein